MRTSRLLGRQLLADRPAVITVAVIVLVTATLAAAVPRAQDALWTRGATHALAQASPSVRDLVGFGYGRPPLGPAGGDVAAPLRATASELAASVPADLRSRLGTPQWAITTSPFSAALEGAPKPLDDPRVNLAMRGGSGWEQRVTFVRGQPPRGATSAGTGIVVDLALSAEASRLTKLNVGQRLSLSSTRGATPYPVLGVVTGIFEPRDARDPFWYPDATILHPQLFDDGNAPPLRTGMALVADAALPMIVDAVPDRPEVRLRLPVEPGQVTDEQAASLVGALAKVRSTSHLLSVAGAASSTGADPAAVTSIRLTSRLDEALTSYTEQRRTAEGLLAIVVAGLLVVALGVLALSARVVLDRRRRHLALAVARGASPAQVRAVLAGEGLLLGVPAAAIALLATARLVPGRPGLAGILLPLLLGVSPAIALPALARAGGLRGVRRDLGRASVAARWSVEALAVLVPIAGLVLLRGRGPSSGSDPLLAATPVLLAVATGVVVLRLYPWPVAKISSVAARRRGAVGFLAMSRAGRDPAAGTVPVLVLVLALSTAVVSMVITGTTAQGARDAAWAAVGADARLTGATISPGTLARARTTPGVAHLSGWTVLPDAKLVQPNGSGVPVTVVAADTAELAMVQRDVPSSPSIPSAVQSGHLGAGGRVPALASAAAAGAGDLLDLGTATAGVQIAGVAGGSGTEGQLPGLPGVAAWLLVSRQALEAATGGDYSPQEVVLSFAKGATPDLAGLGRLTGATVPPSTPSVVAGDLLRAPLVQGVRGSLPLGLAVAGLLIGLAVTLTLVVGARSRARLVAQLATFGLSSRQSKWLAVVELAPVALAALVTGVALGLATPSLVAPALDLRPFTGGEADPAQVWPLLPLLGLAVAFVALVVVGVAASAAVSRRANLGAVLRADEEA